MKYKIIKRIHSYSDNGKVEFVIFKKSIFRWYISDHYFNCYSSYEKAEEMIMIWFSKGQGGIIEIDGNIYKLYNFCLPTI